MALDKLSGDYGSARTLSFVEKLVTFGVPTGRTLNVVFNLPSNPLPVNGFFVGFLLEYVISENGSTVNYSKLISGIDIRTFLNRALDFPYAVVYDELIAPYLRFNEVYKLTGSWPIINTPAPFDRFKNKSANIVVPDYIPLGTVLSVYSVFRKDVALIEGFTVDNPSFQNPNPIPYVHKLP